MNPNYLTKDELLYELGIRGIDSGADTHSLRKLFRSIANRDLPLNVSYLTSASIEALYLCVFNKVSELQDLVVRSGTNWSLVAPRVSTKLRHLRGRLRHLTEAGLGCSPGELLGVRELQSRLDLMEQHTAARRSEAEHIGQLPSDQMGGDAGSEFCSF